MQHLQNESVAPDSADACARQLLTCVPGIMRFIREHMRAHRQSRLSLPQFRALIFVSHNEESSLSALADHLGLSLPAASRMVQVLVGRGLMHRRARTNNRRSISLTPTRRGRAAYTMALRATQAALAKRFDALSGQELSLVGGALGVLGRVFAAETCPMKH